MRFTQAFLAGVLIAAISTADAADVVVTVDPGNTYQEIEGFGASLTDSSAYLLRNEMTGTALTNLLRSLFSPTNGIGLSLLRQPMGASDFRLQDYTYNDRPAGQTDFNLANFSIAYDESYIIPLLKDIVAVNTNMKLIVTPWSAPAWMKDNQSLYGGELRADCTHVFAAYLRESVQAYEAHGLPINYITLQNEPLYAPSDYPGMYMSSSRQIELVERLGRDFESNGIATKILAYDHNWDQFNYPISVLNSASAGPWAAGSAFHGYAGDVAVQSLVHNEHPDKEIHITECSGGDWSGTFSASLMWDVQTLIIGGLRNYGKSVIKWNLALDQNGGPKIAGGCEDARGIVTINTSTDAVITNSEYYALGHVSQFVKRGARRISSSENVADGPYTVAFVNPDGSLVAVACNGGEAARDFTFRWSGQSFNYILPAQSVATFTWPNVSGATVDVWITTGDATKRLQKQGGLVRFSPCSIEWKGVTWSVQDSIANPDNNRWSASCVSVDTNGYLRIGVQQLNGTWYCGQVEATDSMGHGTYRWKAVGRPDQLHTNVVGGLALAHDSAYSGLDIEFTRAYEGAPTNLYYTVQPYYEFGHQFMKSQSLTGTMTTHEFRWTPRRVEYRSWYGHTDEPPASSAVFAQWTYEGDDVPADTNELARMSLWMFNGLHPSSSQELVLADFAYHSATGAFLADDFADGVVSNIWEKYNAPGSLVTESEGKLAAVPSASDGYSLGVRSTNTLSWEDDGLTYRFSANLASVLVSSARSAGGADIWAYHGLVSGQQGIFDPCAASNAVTLRAGYDESANVLTIELLAKMNAPGSWGTSLYIGQVNNASAFLNGSGLDLTFDLVYSNYEVNISYQGNPVVISTITGSSTGLHNLGVAIHGCRYVVGAQNNDDGRGAVWWNGVDARAVAELPSMANGNGNGGPGETVVQIGLGSASTTWKSPIDTTYTRHRSQILYRADDIGRSGMITQLFLNILSPPPIALTQYTIRMQHTSLQTMNAAFINTGWTTVYQANTTIPADFKGWFAFDLSQPFPYSMASNLLVDFVFQNASKNSRIPAATYTVSDYDSCHTVSGDKNDPFGWVTAPIGRTYKYSGKRVIDVRLAFPDDIPVPIGLNLSFEDGALGFLTNVPNWEVEGSVYAGAIRAHPAHHGAQSLKLWKADGAGDQKLTQYIDVQVTNEYTLTGFVLTESGEPFRGTGARGALAFQWFNGSGLIRTDESTPFTSANTPDLWYQLSVAATPPPGTTSGRVVCALFSSPDQAGSLYFDRLYISAKPSTGSGGVPLSPVTTISDGFQDSVMSNCWELTGNWEGASFTQSDGLLTVRPGSNEWQSSGYVSAQPVNWTNNGPWTVFSATLSTIRVDVVSGSNDIETLLGICSQKDNPWWVTNSIGLYGYYNVTENHLVMQLMMKADAPASSGNERFNATISNVSQYLNVTNGIRMSIALGQDSYEVRFSDAGGIPIPYTLNGGSARGLHMLGDKLCSGYWLVGAQNDNARRGEVVWADTEVRTTEIPGVNIGSVLQTSTDGSGRIEVMSRVWDDNGDFCRLFVEVSTNRGFSWRALHAAAVDATLSASLASTQRLVNVVSIQSTNNLGLTASNEVTVAWDSIAGGLAGAAITDLLVRVTVDDGFVGPSTVTSAYAQVDNRAPSHDLAEVVIDGGQSVTVQAIPSVVWWGFEDAHSQINGYYYSLKDGSTTSSGIYTLAEGGVVEGVEEDATNTVYVWAVDSFGNIGQAVDSSIVVLSQEGDFDGDGYSNYDELVMGTDAVDSQSMTTFDGYLEEQTGEYVVDWNTVLGRLYSLYTSESLTGEWEAVSGCIDMEGTGEVVIFEVDMQTSTSRYFRIGVRQP